MYNHLKNRTVYESDKYAGKSLLFEFALVEAGLGVDFVNFSKRGDVGGGSDIEAKVEFLKSKLMVVHTFSSRVNSSSRPISTLER